MCRALDQPTQPRHHINVNFMNILHPLLLHPLRKTYWQCYHWLFPFTCVICADPTQRNLDLCLPCEQELPRINNACCHCALPLTNTDMTICGACLASPPPYDRTLALCYYQQPLERLIINLKFHQRLLYAKVLGTLMTEYLIEFYADTALPECIIPVPLHQRRLRERGYNQALEIARPIHKYLKIPIDTHHCQRLRPTQAQSGLHAKQRQDNVFQAFTVATNFKPRHVAIIDDVVTTGHTVAELSRVLRLAGVEQIDVWCCARTKLDIVPKISMRL
ncbi:ComF family protein [soil metagenome]